MPHNIIGVACNLWYSYASTTVNWALEGIPQQSGDGSYFSIPCYSGVAQVAKNVPSSGVNPNSPGTVTAGTARIIVSVHADLGTDVATFSDAYSGNAAQFHTAVTMGLSSPTTGYWTAGTSSTTCDGNGGVRYIPYQGTTTTLLTGSTSGVSRGCSSPGAGAVSIYNGQLYASFQDSVGAGTGIYTLGTTNLPTSGTPTSSILPGTAGTPWSFIFQSPTVLWVADSSAVANMHIVQYTYSPTKASWVAALTGPLFPTSDAVYSITGRFEGASWILYAVSVSKANAGSGIYKWNTTSGTATTIATTAAVTSVSSQYRGVVLPPVWPSSSASPTQTPSQTRTPSQTPSNTGTASHTAPVTVRIAACARLAASCLSSLAL